MIREGVYLGKRYEILGRIGSGGMADVYKGKDHKLNRYVAIKVLKSDYRQDEVFIKKFLSEAQAAAGLMHPNVVNVYDVGQDERPAAEQNRRGISVVFHDLANQIFCDALNRNSAREAASPDIPEASPTHRITASQDFASAAASRIPVQSFSAISPGQPSA